MIKLFEVITCLIFCKFMVYRYMKPWLLFQVIYDLLHLQYIIFKALLIDIFSVRFSQRDKTYVSDIHLERVKGLCRMKCVELIVHKFYE